MISLEEEPCCQSMGYAIKKWVLYADWIDDSLSINEELFEGEEPVDDFKFCPWCSKKIPHIEEWEFDKDGEIRNTSIGPTKVRINRG